MQRGSPKVAGGDQRSFNMGPESEPGANRKERRTLSNVIEADKRNVFVFSFPTDDYSINLPGICGSGQKA